MADKGGKKRIGKKGGRAEFAWGVLTGLFFAGGAAMLVLPWVSDALSRKQSASMATVYAETVEETGAQALQEALLAAAEYNSSLLLSQVRLADPFDEKIQGSLGSEYSSLLDIDSNGVMCWIDIPAIDVYLPVYHGTSDEVLSRGAGHMEGSSLPVGGKSTHAVITGHTGLTSAKLFTDLAELKEGNMFYIHVCGETLAYEVTDIQTVLPDETDPLLIRKGEDLVTLVTCTPYGVNTHRLFVTGTRTEYNAEVYEAETGEAAENASDSEWMRSYRNAVLSGIFTVVALRAVTAAARGIYRKRKAGICVQE